MNAKEWLEKLEHGSDGSDAWDMLKDLRKAEAEVERLTQYAADCNALLIIETAKAKDAKAEVERLNETLLKTEEHCNADLKMARKHIEKLIAENARLREALEFYSDINNYSVRNGVVELYAPVARDAGDKAREALKGGAQ